jgi:glutathione S-transferase
MEMNNTNLTVYGDHISQPTRSVMLFCMLNKILFNFVYINLGKGEHYTEEYKKINPWSKVPCIRVTQKDGIDKVIKESCTILRFLSGYYKVDNKWYSPNNIFRQSMINEWLDWHHSNSRYILSNAVFREVFLPNLIKAGVQRDVPDTKARIPKLLAFLDKQFQQRDFIVDNEMSIADLIISCEINQLELIGFDFNGYPSLKRYLDKLNALPEMKEVNEMLFKLKGRLLEKAKPKF